MPVGREEAGQVMALVALCLGLRCCCAWAASVLALQVVARSRLQQAAAAAALAEVQHASVRMRLAVRYRDERCVRRTGRLECRATSGSLAETVTPAAFAIHNSVGFGALPGWAQQAGCVGTVWPTGGRAGSYRICWGQRLLAASLLLPPDPQGLAQQWLTAALTPDTLVRAPRVAAVKVDAGRVLVTASARLRPGFPGADVLFVRASAWPGTP
jgi:hypothetical protein